MLLSPINTVISNARGGNAATVEESVMAGNDRYVDRGSFVAIAAAAARISYLISLRTVLCRLHSAIGQAIGHTSQITTLNRDNA